MENALIIAALMYWSITPQVFIHIFLPWGGIYFFTPPLQTWPLDWTWQTECLWIWLPERSSVCFRGLAWCSCFSAIHRKRNVPSVASDSGEWGDIWSRLNPSLQLNPVDPSLIQQSHSQPTAWSTHTPGNLQTPEQKTQMHVKPLSFEVVFYTITD